MLYRLQQKTVGQSKRVRNAQHILLLLSVPQQEIDSVHMGGRGPVERLPMVLRGTWKRGQAGGLHAKQSNGGTRQYLETLEQPTAGRTQQRDGQEDGRKAKSPGEGRERIRGERSQRNKRPHPETRAKSRSDQRKPTTGSTRVLEQETRTGQTHKPITAHGKRTGDRRG